MRILSQEAEGIGTFDVPYELCVVSIGKTKKTRKPCIYVRCNLFGDCSVVAAEYSSPEKAKRAMEMLQKYYSPLLIIKDLGIGIEADIKPNDWEISRTEPNGIRGNYYFRFPDDAEVEVRQ